MGFDDFDNPYRAPEVPFEVVRESAPRGAYFWVRSWIILQMIVAVVGTAAAFVDVETIVATGPILSIFGIFGTIVCVRKRYYFGALIGALMVGLMANYTGFLAPKVALFSNIALMACVLLWRPQGVYPVANR